MILRILNIDGQDVFREYLNMLRKGSREDPPLVILENDEYTSPLIGNIEMEENPFRQKNEMAGYLVKKLKILKPHVLFDAGLWSWISLFYFDMICPRLPDGTRTPYEDYYYIPSKDYRHRYRHLLAGPFHIRRLYPGTAHCLLSGPVEIHGEFTEQIASRMNLMANRGILEAIDKLYFDEISGLPKRGARAKNEMPGTLRRLVLILQQYDVTYDLQDMTSDKLLGLLPDEFDAWKKETR